MSNRSWQVKHGEHHKRKTNVGVTKKAAWWGGVDQSIQHHIGTAEERRYFSVMHQHVGKVLWHSPEHYALTVGVTLAGSFKV